MNAASNTVQGTETDMKKWRGVIVFDVVMVILIIILYSPFQLGLSPLDPSIFRAALSIILGVVIIYELIKVNGRAIRKANAEKRFADPDAEMHSSDLKRLFGDYEKKPVVGKYAKQALSELDAVEHRYNALERIISERFMESSITWDKFMAVPISAKNVVTQNCDLLLHRIQNFDIDTYNRLMKRGITSSIRHGNSFEERRDEKRAFLESNINDMNGIIGANENIIVELDNFITELSKPENFESAETNSHILEEINTLIEQTKYYK